MNGRTGAVMVLLALVSGAVAGFGGAQLWGRRGAGGGAPAETDPAALGWRALRRGELSQARAEFARIPRKDVLDAEGDRGEVVLHVLDGDVCGALAPLGRMRIKLGSQGGPELARAQQQLEKACNPLAVDQAPAVDAGPRPRLAGLLTPSADPNMKTSDDAAKHARWQLMSGHPDEALRYATMAVGMDQKNPRAFETLGRVLLQVGANPCLARDAYQEALSLGLEERLAVNVRANLSGPPLSDCR